MRAPVLFVAGLALLLSAGVPTGPAAAAPCTAAAAECARWVSMGGGARALAYATYALDARNERVTRALVVVHGAGGTRTTTSARRWPPPSWPTRWTTPS
ncbi:MAG TPA: hypothetical protein VN323_06735 [Candidatus Dormibacteraeota bacterium]|nr:hypothetical protein [Candidatus Dormibacteraeota bacterium]